MNTLIDFKNWCKEHTTTALYEGIDLAITNYTKSINDAPDESRNVNARAFVESCGDMTEYVDGAKIAHRFKKFTVPVVEYNELRKAADKWDSEHVR